MSHTKQLAGGAAGVVVTMSLLVFAPAASADGPDSGRARNDIGSSTTDQGRARNDIGSYHPGGSVVPFDGGTSTDSGTSTQDVLIGTAAGLLAVGGATAAAISIRRRNPMAHHPA